MITAVCLFDFLLDVRLAFKFDAFDLSNIRPLVETTDIFVLETRDMDAERLQNGLGTN